MARRKNPQPDRVVSGIEPVLTVITQGTSKFETNSEGRVPSIYNSPEMRCVFTMGKINENADQKNRFTRADLPAELEVGAVWCGGNSGVDPWNPAQRLAQNPHWVARHYKEAKFDDLVKVQPEGQCLESLMNARACPRCSAKKSDECKAPRTWIIGSCICYAHPYVRSELDQVARSKNQGPYTRKGFQVVPTSSLETKRE